MELIKWLLCIVLFAGAYEAKSIQGFIYDCSGKESIIGATVFCKTQNVGVLTNEQGYFYLNITLGPSDTVVISYIGYKDHIITLQDLTSPVKVCLERGVQLDEITIYSKGKDRYNDRINIITMPISQAMKLPTLFGEPDILKALQTKAGVTGGFEGSSGLFVRGGTPDQNLILVDNNPIFNTGHALGFVSLFNGDAIKKMELYKGYIPPKYGGRLSSVLDLQMREGDQQNTKINASIGLLSSKMFLSTPIIKNKFTFILNARSSYLGLITYPLKLNYNKGSSNEYQNYRMYDVNAKLHYKINDLNQISINHITAYDNYYKLERFGGLTQKVSNDWGNSTTSIRYNSILSQKLVFNFNVGINRYISDITGGVLADASRNASLTSGILNSTMKSELTYSSKRQQINAGLEYRHESLNPGTYTNEKGEQYLLYPNKEALSTFSIFAEDIIRVSDKVNLRGGIRLNRYTGKDLDEIKPEPRFELSFYTKKNDAFRIAYNRMFQNVTLLANNGLSFPTDFWIPNGGILPLSQADHISIGSAFKRFNINFEVDVFYKYLHHLSGLKPGRDLFDFSVTATENYNIGIEGRVKGLELSLSGSTHKLNWSMAYTLSKNERRTPAIDQGNWYPFEFDRRHNLSLVGQYEFNDRWQANLIFNLSSGRHYTLPTSYYVKAYLQDNINPFLDLEPQYTTLNNAKFPVYHRLDIGFIRTYEKSSLSFGFYNTYGRNNPFYIISKPTMSDNNRQQIVNTRFIKKGLIGPIPYISFTYNFK